jgi:protein TonB
MTMFDDSRPVFKLDSADVDSLRRAGVILERDVAERPRVLTTGQLRYPDDLRMMGVQGRVVLRFVIGLDGRVEPSTISLVSADDAGFISPAREALRTARFRPGRVGGRPVRTLVNLPFDFKIRRRSRMTRIP